VHTKTNVGAFPVGASVDLLELSRDPYPIYGLLQAREPISWIEALGMWYVTRYEDVRAILMDSDNFTTACEKSLIFDTFGSQMLTTEGAEHERYRRAVQPHFSLGFIRKNLESAIEVSARALVAGFKDKGLIELRAAIAARLPIQVILRVFGLPLESEPRVRAWYDSFERALANFTWSDAVRREARINSARCHEYLAQVMAEAAENGKTESLLGALVNAPAETRLSDEEIRRNMLIIFFGGISTVEAVILNALWALFTHPAALARVCADLSLVDRVVEETLRWLSPVQSATRHVLHATSYKGVQFAAGDVVNCMLGAANRDQAVFADAACFDIDRPNTQRHLGFATGLHACLGFNLAKTEARIALQVLLRELEDMTAIPDMASPPEGYEFRQPRSMYVRWRAPG
jgi:cytochrome P450